MKRIYWFGIVLFLAACSQLPDAPPTAVFTQAVTMTHTPRPTEKRPSGVTPGPTLTHTATPLPSHTPIPVTSTPFPTNTPPPTFTPAAPLADNSAYQLILWTPEQAEQLTHYFIAYPDTLKERGQYDYYYYYSYRFAFYSLSETLLQFPNHPAALDWKWSKAYYAALFGHKDVGDFYIHALLETLNNDIEPLEAMSEWLHANYPRTTMEITVLNPPLGYDASYLLKMEEHLSGIAIWLLEDADGYRAYWLTNRGSRFERDFQPEGTGFSVHTNDLNGNGFEEIITSHVIGQATERVNVYDLSQIPPQMINVWPSPESRSRIPVLNVYNEFQPFQFHTSDRLCSMGPILQYKWNGQMMILDNEYLQISTSKRGPSGVCIYTFIREITYGLFSFDDNQEVADYIHNYLDNWPQDEVPFDWWPGSTIYSSSIDEAHDGLQYSLGIFEALTGQHEAAITTLSDIVASPILPQSRGFVDAQKFSDHYQHPSDLYVACSQMEFCNRQAAVQQLLQTLPPEQFPVLFVQAQKLGIPVEQHGRFDIDNDSFAEQWLTIATDNKEEVEFWLLVQNPEGIGALFVGILPVNVELEIVRLTAVYDQPITEITADDTRITFVFSRLFSSGEAYITQFQRIPNYARSVEETEQAIHDITEALLSGVESDQMLSNLLALSESSEFDCDTRNLCPDYLYFLGLAYELSGDESNAVSTYLQLWREYPDSPFTIIVRTKLMLVE